MNNHETSSTVNIRSLKVMLKSAEWLLRTFDERAAASLFLHQTLLVGYRSLGWMLERAGGVHFVHAVHGTWEVRLRVVDGADSSGQGRRRATVALVHPGTVAQVVQLALHLASQVAVGPVVQALHAGILCELLRCGSVEIVNHSSVGSLWTPAGGMIIKSRMT